MKTHGSTSHMSLLPETVNDRLVVQSTQIHCFALFLTQPLQMLTLKRTTKTQVWK